MAIPQSRDGAFNPASPRSSSGAADSFKGTPDTRLTAFSPEDGSAKSARMPHSLGRDAGPIKFPVTSPASLDLSKSKSFYRTNLHLEKDPFVSSTGLAARSAQKLSPTASCFSPFTLSSIARGSSTDINAGIKTEASNSSSMADQSLESRALSASFVHPTLSTDAGLSRCLVISIRSQKVQTGNIEYYFSKLSQNGLQIQGSRYIQVCGDKAYARFGNIRDACLFSQNVHLGGQDWEITYITPREFTQIVDPTSGLITAHEGQLNLAVFAHPSLESIDLNQLQGFVQGVLQAEGDMFAFKAQASGVEGSLLNAVIEYCDNDISLRVVSKLSGTVIDGIQFCMSLHRPDIPTMSTVVHDGIVSPARTTTSGSMSDLTNDFQRLSCSRPASTASSIHNALVSTPTRAYHPGNFPLQQSYGMMPVVYSGMPLTPPYMIDQVPTRSHGMFPGGNYSIVTPMYSQPSPLMSPEYMTPRQFAYPRPDSRRQNAMRVTRAPYYSIPSQHNHVDVDRIREGIDVRTTIMLRNIPNKVDQAMLKRIVDESSWGKYDFMYLRIDFANDCNVGYAFINFVDPLDIIDFVNARGNQRWNCFKSDKVAEISYATIQGKDCLVQKFRNSSVMLEAPHYRPKLYFTSNGPNPQFAGEEEPFPEPDNQSKMKRSCENAEHVGLFTPNAGQHFRDEQRRRRSQYDRGTRLAALEEYDYDSSFPPRGPHHPYSPQ
ncbi:RNA recognition motif 2-domain-containing protein [Pseudomassariella vexata]|uniref:RNA recognition motif 2-domain-containing protein n=1 Tax=Pseudomassariella vexata TaxID=1141098 RepID=A0A1Y2DWB8_9PEZI|nr:RNA recognition motif 2-domain-containing protein [Pseudomassariella vexata]ORY63590.1 RNA recognition motif 2-domain-containing protein [Pseudomassariella vexata]